jgi:hypothetical protein
MALRRKLYSGSDFRGALKDLGPHLLVRDDARAKMLSP